MERNITMENREAEAAKTAFPRMHVSLYVSDLERSLAFYISLFETLPSKVKPGYAKFELDNPSLIISFVEHPERVQNAFGHLGFQVETMAELERKLDHAKRMNLPVLEEMGTNCCYALQDKFWVKDPDGTQWEIYYFHEDVAFNDPKYQTEAEACCAPAMVTENTEVKAEKQKVPLSDLGEGACTPGSGCC